MKNTIVLLLTLAICLSLAACGGGAPAETAPQETTAAATEATEVTEETVDQERQTYEAGLAAMKEKRYGEAIPLFQKLGDYEDARSRMKLCQLYAYEVQTEEGVHFEYMIPRIEMYDVERYGFNMALTNRGETPLVLTNVDIFRQMDGVVVRESNYTKEKFGEMGLGFDALHPGESIRWGNSCPIETTEATFNEMLHKFTFEDPDGNKVEYNYLFYLDIPEDPSYERDGGYIIPDFREVNLGNGPEISWDYQHKVLNDTDTPLTLVRIETYQKLNGMNTISVWYHTERYGIGETFNPGETFEDDGDVHPIVDSFNELEMYFTFQTPNGNEVVKVLKYRLTKPNE